MTWYRTAADLRAQDSAAADQLEFRRSLGGDVPVYEAFGGFRLQGPGGFVVLHNRQLSTREGHADWYRLTGVDGLWDLPGVRQNRTANPDSHGTTTGAMSLDERVIAFEGVVHAGSLRGLRAMERNLKTALAPRRNFDSFLPQGEQVSIFMQSADVDNDWPADSHYNGLQNSTPRADLLTGVTGEGPAVTVNNSGVYQGKSFQQQTVFGSATSSGIYYDNPSNVYDTNNLSYAAGVWVNCTNLGGAANTTFKLYVEFYDANGNAINAFQDGRYATNTKFQPTANTWYYLSDVWDVPKNAVSVKLRVRHSTPNATSTATWLASDAYLFATSGRNDGATTDRAYQIGDAFACSGSLVDNSGWTWAGQDYNIGPLPHNMINEPRGFNVTALPTNTPNGWTFTEDLTQEIYYPNQPPIDYFEAPTSTIGRAWRVGVPSGSSGSSLTFGAMQPVTPAKRYYASMWVRPTIVDMSLKLTMTGYTPAGTGASNVSTSAVACPVGVWTKVDGIMIVPADRSHATLRIETASATASAEYVLAQPMWAAAEEPVSFLDEKISGATTKTAIRSGAGIEPTAIKRTKAGYEIYGDIADIKLAQRHEATKPGSYELPFMITIKCQDPRIYESMNNIVSFPFPTIAPSVTIRNPYDTGFAGNTYPTGTYNPDYRIVAIAPGIAPGGSTQPMPGWVLNQYMDYKSAQTYAGPIDAWGGHVHTDGSVLSKPPYWTTRRQAGVDFVPVQSVDATNMMTMASFATMGQSYLNAGSYDPFRAGDHFGVIVKQVASGERVCTGVMYTYDSDPATSGGESISTKPHLCTWIIYPNAATTGGWRGWLYAKGIQLSGSEWTSPGNAEYWIRAAIYDSSNWPPGAADWNSNGWTGLTMLFTDICNGRPSIDMSDTTNVIARDYNVLPNKLGDGATGGFGTAVSGKRGFCMAYNNSISPFGLVAWEEHLITTPAPQVANLIVPGDAETPPRVTFTGPIKDPRVVIGGKPIGLKGSVPPGESATIDLRRGSMYLGSGDATLDPTSRNAEIAPGNLQITAEGTGTTASISKIDIAYNPAWT